jgi:hypothetical protein
MDQTLSNFGPIGWNRLGADIDGESGSDLSGLNVSLSSDGTTLAIGALFNDASGNLLPDAGHVRVYYWDTTVTPNQWTKRGLDIDGEAEGDFSGHSVSLSSDGTTLAIGAPLNSSAGHVPVYYWDTTVTPNQWVNRGLDIDGEELADWSGFSVSLSSDGTILAIGAPYNDGNGSDAGHVRVYKYDEIYI